MKCDSRNLNLNPLCMLKKGSLPALWTERVKETYKTYERSIPSYISTLTNPMRRRHKDQLLVTESMDELYNAWEEDIAVVNIFFGKDTVMEFERSIRMGPVDFVASLGGLFGLCLGFSIISFLEIVYWILAGIFKITFY